MSFSQMQSQMQSQGLPLPPEDEVGPSTARVNTKESCVGPSGVYEGLTTVHNVPLGNDQVKVGVKDARDVDDRVLLVRQTLNTFLVWPTYLVKPFSEQNKQGAKGPAKSVDMPDPDIDPLYLMTLTISCMTETSMQARNVDVYGFLEPQSIQKSGQSQFESEDYIKKWMQNSQRDVYLGAYLNGVLQCSAHWQMIVILPKDNVLSWFCSLHNSPNNYPLYFGLNDRQYFTYQRPLEPDRMKAIRIEWARYYLKVKHQTLGV
ncbi:hypothetical protein GmHk_11G032656 [Glycine max]|nr:hypothetical protein GmHk_11G032656 [Glycine max]